VKTEGIGIILNMKKVQERFALLFVFSREHGLVKGLIRISTSKKTYKPSKGDFVKFSKSTRLADHLGMFQIELVRSNAVYVLTDRFNLGVLESVLAQVSHFFHEGDVAAKVYDRVEGLIAVLASGDRQKILKTFISFEIFLLAEIGYGLDLSKCAATGEVGDLYYISPKSGCAVSKAAGEPYKNRLFVIPEFMKDASADITEAEIDSTLDMVEFFFQKADVDAFVKFKLNRQCLGVNKLAA